MSKPKSSGPAWKSLASASKVAVDEPAVTGVEADKATPSTDEHAVIRHQARTSTWPQLATRVDPRVKSAYAMYAQRGGSGAGRRIVSDALNAWFLTQEPIDDYTRELHEQHKRQTQ